MRFVRVVFTVVAAVVAAGLFRDQIVMSYRVVRLYTEPPDVSILMPVKGVPRGRVVNTWGAPRSGGRSHEGQDIFARRGTPVVAAAYGVVTRVGDGELGGKMVFVTGRYDDRIVIDGPDAPRFVEKTVVLDSRQIDTLLAIPI